MALIISQMPGFHNRTFQYIIRKIEFQSQVIKTTPCWHKILIQCWLNVELLAFTLNEHNFIGVYVGNHLLINIQKGTQVWLDNTWARDVFSLKEIYWKSIYFTIYKRVLIPRKKNSSCARSHQCVESIHLEVYTSHVSVSGILQHLAWQFLQTTVIEVEHTILLLTEICQVFTNICRQLTHGVCVAFDCNINRIYYTNVD